MGEIEDPFGLHGFLQSVAAILFNGSRKRARDAIIMGAPGRR